LHSERQAADDYKLGPDSQFKAEVPHGRVERFQFTNSTVFPGTVRDGGVYIPAQYDPSKAGGVDGFPGWHGLFEHERRLSCPVSFDNLIATKEMPMTIAIFFESWLAEGQSNRSFEYDSLGDAYAKFFDQRSDSVRDEQVCAGDYGRSGTAGDLRSEFGGICAFTVAWERTDQFRKVLSTIGSFTNIRGGHNIRL